MTTSVSMIGPRTGGPDGEGVPVAGGVGGAGAVGVGVVDGEGVGSVGSGSVGSGSVGSGSVGSGSGSVSVSKAHDDLTGGSHRRVRRERPRLRVVLEVDLLAVRRDAGRDERLVEIGERGLHLVGASFGRGDVEHPGSRRSRWR